MFFSGSAGAGRQGAREEPGGSCQEAAEADQPRRPVSEGVRDLPRPTSGDSGAPVLSDLDMPNSLTTIELTFTATWVCARATVIFIMTAGNQRIEILYFMVDCAADASLATWAYLSVSSLAVWAQARVVALEAASAQAEQRSAQAEQRVAAAEARVTQAEQRAAQAKVSCARPARSPCGCMATCSLPLHAHHQALPPPMFVSVAKIGHRQGWWHPVSPAVSSRVRACTPSQPGSSGSSLLPQ